MTTQPITAALFDFLRDLRENNDREWFQANKGRYLTEVRDPMLDFIGAFAGPLAEISPHFVADPRPNGGSLFRIYRDTRDSRGTRRHTRRTRGRIFATPRERTRTRPASISIWSPGCASPGAGCGGRTARP